MKRIKILMFTFLIAWLMPLSGYCLQFGVDYDYYVFEYQSSEIHFSWVTDEEGEEVGVDIWDEAIDFNIINSIPKQVECVFYKTHDDNGHSLPIEIEVARRSYSFTAINRYNGDTHVIVIPDFIKRIGNHAFSDNTNITEIVIPETLKEIGEGAFSNTNITKLIIPETLEKIGDNAFDFCENLSFVSIKANDNLKCGAYPFWGASQLETVIFEEGTTIIPDGICASCKGLKNITLPSTLIKIGGAFGGCTSLEEIEFPDRLEEIGEGAFDGDKSLKEITLPNSLTKIGRQAFYGCSSLTKVISLIQEPFDVDITTFWEDDVTEEYWLGKYIKVTNADLYVPVGTKKKYEDLVTRGFNAWKAFNSIIEMEGTGIEDPIEKVALTAKNYTREYGEENPKFEYDVTEGSITSGTPEITCETTTESSVGTYDIIISKGSVSNNEVTLTNGKLTITKAPLTIKANSYTIKQGEALPEFKVEYEDFKNGETSDVLTKQPVLTTSATSTSEPGTYEIVVSGAEAENYEISYVKGTLTITETDPVKVTAKSYTIEYGESIPAFEYTSEGAALSGTPEIRCAATSASASGTYDIVISKGSVSNFNDTYVNGTLIITKAPLTIKAKSYTIKQGDALPEFKVEYEGFKNGETSDVLTKQPVLTTSATSTSEPGTYDIIASGAEAENYEISYVKGTLTITDTEPVKVTAKSYKIEYGESIPAFEYTSEGASLRGVPEIRCAATAGSAAGTYDIVISKGSVSNFNDTYVNGTLTITKAPLVISVGEYTKQEGEENPEFELTYEGFKNGESDGVLTKLPVVTCVATKDSEPGEYVITIDGAEAENYDIRYAPGKLTVTPKPLPEITPIEGEISVNTEGLSEADLTDNVVNDVYYNVGEQGYDAAEKSIVISEATNMAQIADKEPGSKDVKESFNGIIMKVGKGFGLITVSAKTSGNAQLVVQVGESGMPMIASRTEKGDVVVSYDVSEDTYVYIYAILGSSAAKLVNGDVKDNDSDIVRIYGITVSPGATGVRNFNGNDNVNGNDDAYYTIDGKKLDAAPKKGEVYIRKGRKVVK